MSSPDSARPGENQKTSTSKAMGATRATAAGRIISGVVVRSRWPRAWRQRLASAGRNGPRAGSLFPPGRTGGVTGVDLERALLSRASIAIVKISNLDRWPPFGIRRRSLSGTRGRRGRRFTHWLHQAGNRKRLTAVRADGSLARLRVGNRLHLLTKRTKDIHTCLLRISDPARSTYVFQTPE